jgi:S-formylglutathione hydrolase FrmB
MATHGTGWQELTFDSDALRGNPLGDPHVRPLFVWTPPSYAADSERRYPSVYLLQSHTGKARAWFNVSPFDREFVDVLDEELRPEALVVLVDAFTTYGGSQFLDSPAIGHYHTYLCDELVPFVDASFRTLAARDHRGIGGKSSGGFGAFVSTVLRPDLFGALACHAGDALFDVTLRGELAPAAKALRDCYGGSWEAFFADFRSGRPTLSNRTDPLLLSLYSLAAAFSPREDGSVDLPFDPETAEVIPEVWERWLAWDPVRLVPQHAETLRALRGIWLDAGRGDEYALDLGAVALTRELRAAGVGDDVLRFELFDGGHRGISFRYGPAVEWLVARLTP